MNERIFICLGGSGHRLKGTESMPKALFELDIFPTPGLGTGFRSERVLDRHLRMLPKDIPITLCTGFRHKLVEKLYPKVDQIVTYDPDDPVGILCCFRDVLKWHDLESYTFLLGDTVWSPEALKEALDRRHETPLSFYGKADKAPCEIYMATFSGQGLDLIRGVFAMRNFVTVPSLEPHPTFTLRGGKIWLLVRWMQQDKAFQWDKVIRMIRASCRVNDFDTDEQKDKLWERYREGFYDAGS